MNIIFGSLKSIYRKKSRSMLTMIGVAIGVFSVMIINAIGDTGKTVINQEMSNLGIDGILIGVDTSKTNKRLSNEHVELVSGLNTVKQAMPLLMKYSYVKIHSETTKCVIFGVDQNAEDMVSLNLMHGRMITKNDIDSNEDICIIDESLAMQMYSRSNIVGKTINIALNGSYREFTIAGVVESESNVLQGLMGEYIPCFIYAPVSTVQQYYKTGYDQIMVKLKNESTDTQQIIKVLEEDLGEESLSIQNLVQQKDKINSLIDIVTSILTVIGAVSLLVSGISIMSIMLASVQERTREIGIKKALGASRGRIMLEFLAEALLICLFGSLAGIVMGISIAWAGCTALGFSLSLKLKTLAFCMFFTCFIGVLFGVYPAMRAANLNPVDALRTD